MSIDQIPTANVEYKIKAAVNHISVNIGQWKIYSFPWRVGHHFWVLVKISHGQKPWSTQSMVSLHDLTSTNMETFIRVYLGSLVPGIVN